MTYGDINFMFPKDWKTNSIYVYLHYIVWIFDAWERNEWTAAMDSVQYHTAEGAD